MGSCLVALMSIEYRSKVECAHPITKLSYDLTTTDVDVGEMMFRLTTLSHVETAIDRVFDWLASEGRDANEIEHLAPYFGVVWPSALALCGFLLQKKWSHWLPGRSVLELGCGLALPSMVSARLGARVLATDSHPDVPRFLERNVAQNEPCRLEFSEIGCQKDRARSFDLIMASDVLYESSLVNLFANEITRNSGPETVALVADPGRPYIQDFVSVMGDKGWNNDLQPWSVRWMGEPHDIYLLKLSKKVSARASLAM
jgi:predicted nicotinamide N-methyase